jgi:peptide subunit release factor 1 (eRF1)
MGCRYEYKCPSCGYTVMTSAGPSRGFNITTDTFVCTACNIIQDLTTGEAPGGAMIPMSGTGKREYKLLCKQCRSADHLAKWDSALQTCPKCETGMEKNEWAIVMWD